MTESIEIKAENRLELIIGLTLAIFAAMLAICELGSSKFGKEQLISNNQKAEAYQWYQSKSIKQSLAESNHDLVKTLLSSGVINPDKKESVEKYISGIDANIKRYSKEKDEILKGSDMVGKDNWVQDKDGKMGQIVGADEYAAKSEKLAEACDNFELALLFLQVCMVLGAISLVIKQDKMKIAFYIFVLALGIMGIIYGIHGFLLASAT